MVTPGKEKLHSLWLLSCLISHPDGANITGISGGIDQNRDLMHMFLSTLNLMERHGIWTDKNYKVFRFAHPVTFFILSIYPCIMETIQIRAFPVRETISSIYQGFNRQEPDRIGRFLIPTRETGLISGRVFPDFSFRVSDENERKTLPERGYDHLDPITSSPQGVYREKE